MSKPAFPQKVADISIVPNGCEGMTLLEYYAGQALVGLIANGGDACDHDGNAAAWSFSFAEAMIKEAEKRSK